MTQIQVAKPNIDKEEINAAIEVLKSGNYVSGKKVEEFEEMFANYIGTDYAVACSNGTAALHMAILATLGNGSLGEIMVPTVSFFSTASSVLMTENDLAFISVKKEDYQIDVEEVEKKINEFTKAIIPVHLFGYPCDIKKIMEIAEKYNLKVIEDCAQAHGAEVDGQKVGSFGDANCFSFYATKNMTTMEGGIITTNNPEVAKKCKRLRNHGMLDKKTHIMLGYNYRMTELQAVIGIEQLKKLDDMNKKRIEISEFITSGINSGNYYEYMSSQPLPLYKSIPENFKCVYFWLPVRCSYSEEFREFLKRKGIGYRYRYDKILPYQPIFRKEHCLTDVKVRNAPIGELTGLPNHPGLREEEIKKVVEAVNEFPTTLHKGLEKQFLRHRIGDERVEECLTT